MNDDVTAEPIITPPEATEISRRLACIPDAWQTYTLRQALLEGALAAAFHREAQERQAFALEAVQLAAEARDVSALEHAFTRLQAAERVVETVHAPQPVHVPGATAAAEAELTAAIAVIPLPPLLAVHLEREAWASWPHQWRSLDRQPVTLPADVALIERLAAWRTQSMAINVAVSDWTRPELQVDSLAALERAVVLLMTAREVAAEGNELCTEAERANASREAAGLTWDAQPADVAYTDQVTSPALRALAKFREQRQAVPA